MTVGRKSHYSSTGMRIRDFDRIYEVSRLRHPLRLAANLMGMKQTQRPRTFDQLFLQRFAGGDWEDE